ncbi:hypothetical protein SDC9_194958 [bioreactor metagenome]|uniref:Uncharacterized protein n=1 Tax=bioreactor metagenome TaxID=1076179 RepID=A0A645I8W4_9ZZZZ
MPYINSKLTIKLSEQDKEVLKNKMGEIITETSSLCYDLRGCSNN